MSKHAFGTTRKGFGVSLVFDAEPSDGDTIDLFLAGGELVSPRNVIGRAARQHFDRGVPRKAFSDVPGVEFGTAVDGRAVPLDDDRKLHCSDVGGACGSSSAVRIESLEFVDGASAACSDGAGVGFSPPPSPWPMLPADV